MAVTPSEAYLSNLCKRSFLSLWSYPNVFNDKGINEGKGIGKEVCDLLIVFGNDIIIFSDKSCRYKNTGHLKTDWNRWYRKAIRDSANQLYGAERWLTRFPQRIFLDNKATIPFPFPLPTGPGVRIHRIAVAVGAKEECQAFFNGGSGSLRSNNHLQSEMDKDSDDDRAFTIGRSKGAYIHVLDDVALDAVLHELDTISDFTEYLRKKEDLIERHMVFSTGEEELLALYMTSMDGDGRHGFDIPNRDISGVLVPEGGWADLKSHIKYAARRDANKISYIWDKLIEEFTRRFLANEMSVPVALENFEKALRRMASLDRFERRIVGQKFYSVISTTTSEASRFSAGRVKNGELAFAFVLLAPPPNMTYTAYQEARIRALDAYCHIVKNKYRDIKEIVGIALEPHKKGRGGSETLAYIEFGVGWTEEDAENARHNQTALGLSLPENRFHEVEYPDS